MSQRQTNDAQLSWDWVLAQSPEVIASNIRQAVTDCHAAISKLTLRDEVAPEELSQIQKEVNGVITAVTGIKNRLSATDAQIKTLSNDPPVKRYFKITEALEGKSGTVSPSERQALEQERDMIFEKVSPSLKELRELLRTCLVMRLEMIRYWKWILKKAIDIYTSFKLVVRENLRTICDQIQDPSLSQLVRDVVSSDDFMSVDMVSSARHWFARDLQDIDRQAVQELEDLCTVESRLQDVRESVAELENSETLILQEVQRSGGEPPPPDTSPPTRVLIRGLDPMNKRKEHPSSGRIFKRNHNTQ
ncbi:MAG: hypothetical protein ABIH23_36150 [bacterium]